MHTGDFGHCDQYSRGSRAWQLSSAHVARWGPMVGSAAPPSRARRPVSEPLCHVLSLTSKRRAVGSPRVAFLAARRYFLLPSARPLRRGEGGGVAGGEDGPRRWGGWRRRRPAWLAARPQPTFAAERKEWGLRRANRAGMRCVCKAKWRSWRGSFASLLLV